ncbi:MAG: TetR/AcrR family transcriptional regulator [Leptolyngbyaceae cyanobacterium]
MTMSKAEETRSHIIEKSVSLFNQKGYAGASMSDIMQATGLKKGGIYNHFKSKDELALAAFDHAMDITGQRYWNAVAGATGAIAQLQAIVHTFCTSIDEIPFEGGCPLMNTAIDSDDAHPALRERVQQAMTQWRGLIMRVVQRGIDKGEIHDHIVPEAVASILIATLEGAMMLTRLYGDRTHLDLVQAHLGNYIAATLQAESPTS